MPKNQKKKAFTLTELLVVVVIIGVLAAVVLPKFNKVVETRKTTEAEEIMAAVRTEQEYRCSMDKPYVGDISKLSEIIPQVQTKNFTYQLETNGMLASSRGKYTYNLKMPSYADGRVCCDGAECTKLNKDYPLCDDLIARADYKASTECAAEIPVAAPCVDNSGHYAGETQDTTNAAGCTVRKTWVSFNSAPGVCAWETTENIISCPACDDNDPLATKKDTRKCKPDAYPTLECGEQTKGYYCNASTNYQYVAEPDDAWSTCEPTDTCHQEADCCDEGFTGNFAECIGQKYGYESTEYKCARPGSGYGECKFSLGLGSGTGDINSLSASEEYKDWLRGGYHRWACDRKVPCADEPPDPVGRCNECGTQSLVWECHDSGRWIVASRGECSKQLSDCPDLCFENGATQVRTHEQYCGYEDTTYLCEFEYASSTYGHWKAQPDTLVQRVKPGKECITGQVVHLSPTSPHWSINPFGGALVMWDICSSNCEWVPVQTLQDGGCTGDASDWRLEPWGSTCHFCQASSEGDLLQCN